MAHACCRDAPLEVPLPLDARRRRRREAVAPVDGEGPGLAQKLPYLKASPRRPAGLLPYPCQSAARSPARPVHAASCSGHGSRRLARPAPAAPLQKPPRPAGRAPRLHAAPAARAHPGRCQLRRAPLRGEKARPPSRDCPETLGVPPWSRAPPSPLRASRPSGQSGNRAAGGRGGATERAAAGASSRPW